MKFIYQFSVGDSFLHKIDPRSKMFFLACYLVALWALPLPFPVLLAGGVVLALWFVGGINPAEYYNFLVFLLPIMAVITFVQVATGPAPYFRISLGPASLFVSSPGLVLGLNIAFRLAAMGILFMGFSMTTDPFHWGMSLYRSGLPYKASYMFGFAMRFFPLLQEELNVISDALKARASDTVGSINPLKVMRRLQITAIPLGLSALNRSQTIALAMELRGFSLPEELGIERTLYREVGFSWRDRVVWILSIGLVLGTILMRALVL